MAKITMKSERGSKTIPELFEIFLMEKDSMGVSPTTIRTYRNKYRACSCFYNLDVPIDEFTQDDIVKLTLNMKSGRKLDEMLEDMKKINA